MQIILVGFLIAGVMTASGLATEAGARSRYDGRFGPLAVYQNTRFGYSFTYPREHFFPEPESPRGDGRSFYSQDRKAKVTVFGAHNSEKFTMDDYRKTLLKEFDGYEQVTYQPRGRTWFVLSGYHKGLVYYQKVMFSCENEIISVMAVKWPVENREHYDPIIEVLEKNFHPGAGANAPEDCR